MENNEAVTLSLSLQGLEMVINMEIFHLQDGKLAVVECICQEIETEMIYIQI